MMHNLTVTLRKFAIVRLLLFISMVKLRCQNLRLMIEHADLLSRYWKRLSVKQSNIVIICATMIVSINDRNYEANWFVMLSKVGSINN